MHYTEGENYNEISPTVREFVDRDTILLTPGTTAEENFLNAVQYEIANTVIAGGLTPNATGAADKADGFNQLKQAIFENAAIGTAALTNGAVTRGKLATDIDESNTTILTNIATNTTTSIITTPWKCRVELVFLLTTPPGVAALSTVLAQLRSGGSTFVNSAGDVYLDFVNMGLDTKKTVAFSLPYEVEASRALSLVTTGFNGTVSVNIESVFVTLRRIS